MFVNVTGLGAALPPSTVRRWNGRVIALPAFRRASGPRAVRRGMGDTYTNPQTGQTVDCGGPCFATSGGPSSYNYAASQQLAAYNATPEAAFEQAVGQYQASNPGALVIPTDLSTGPPTMQQVQAAMNAQATYIGGVGATATSAQINNAYNTAMAAYNAGLSAAQAVQQTANQLLPAPAPPAPSAAKAPAPAAVVAPVVYTPAPASQMSPVGTVPAAPVAVSSGACFAPLAAAGIPDNCIQLGSLSIGVIELAIAAAAGLLLVSSMMGGRR